MMKYQRLRTAKKKQKKNCKVYVKQFSGATTDCMKDYIRHSLRNLQKHFILMWGKSFSFKSNVKRNTFINYQSTINIEGGIPRWEYIIKYTQD